MSDTDRARGAKTGHTDPPTVHALRNAVITFRSLYKRRRVLAWYIQRVTLRATQHMGKGDERGHE